MSLPIVGDPIDPSDVLESFGATLESGVSGGVWGYRIGHMAVVSFSLVTTGKSYGQYLFYIPYRAQLPWWASVTCINEGWKRHVYINQQDTGVRLGNISIGSGVWITGQLILPIYA